MEVGRREDDVATRLGPRFEWLRHLGRGGHGRVELAFDHMRDRPVAVKLLAGARRGDLKHEFRVVRDLSHPNLVTMLELVLEDELECIVLEYIEGVDLLRWAGGGEGSPPTITRTRTVDASDVDAITAPAGRPSLDRARLTHALSQIADALEFLEQHGLVHGDLKPENVMVDGAGRAVVLDFGIARLTGGRHARPVGTLPYMAPEQLQAGHELTPATDRYAFGVLLYQALHGYLPFVGTAEQVRAAKSRGLAVTSDDPLVALAARLLAPDPAARPTLADVRRILAPERAVAEAPPAPRTMFVGRDDELRRMAAAVRAAVAPVTALVGGPGLGKTSVLERFRADHGSRVLRSRCYANESIRWNAVDALIDELGSLAAEPHEALSLLFPALRLSNSEHPREASTLAAIELVRRAAKELGAILERRGRTLIVVDDAQWADADSLGFLTQLALQAPAIALVLAMRGPDARSQRIIQRLGATGRSLEVIELGPLRAEEARALAESLSVDAGGLEAAAGVPFLIEELARASGHGARLDAVSGAERRLLELLAVNEGPLDTRLLLRIAEGAAPKTLHGLVAERLCRIDREGSERFDVYHDVLRQHVLERLDARERRAIHASLATAMMDGGFPNDGIAHHLLGAGDVRARRHVAQAADEAVEVLAFDRAAGWLRRLLALVPPGEERSLRERLADCHRRAEDHTAAAEELERIASMEDPEAAIETRRRAAEQWLTAGELERGLDVLRALSLEGKLDGYNVARHGALDFVRGRLSLRLRGTKPVRALDATKKPPSALCNHVDLAWTISGCFMLVDPFRAGAIHALGVTKALRLGDDERAFRALIAEAMYSGLYGGLSRRRTDRILAQVESLANELDDDHYRAIEMGTRSIVEVQRGNLRDGVALAPAALERLIAGAKTVGFELMSVRHFYMYALFYLGSFRELTQHVEAEYRDASARRNRHRMSDVSLNHATIAWLLSHGPAVARERAEAAARFWDAVGPNVQRYYAAVSRITVALWENDYEEVWRIVRQEPRVFFDAPVLVAEGLRADMLHTLARAAVAHAAEVRTPASFMSALGIIALLAVDPSPLSPPLARLALAGLASAAGATALADRIAKRAVTALTGRGLLAYAKLAASVEGGVARMAEDAALARVLAPGLAPR